MAQRRLATLAQRNFDRWANVGSPLPIFYFFLIIFISVTCEYSYLGINIPCNGSLARSIISLRNQASKAKFAMFTKSKKLGLEVDVQLQLFDSLVQPIMLYGCEVWGFKNCDVLEKVHIKFYKMILKVNKSTTTAMVLGDLGRLPVEYNVNSRLLWFWYKLICGSDNTFSCIFYKLIYSLHVNQVYTTDWLENIRITLVKCNLTEFWLNQQKVKALSFNSFKGLYKEKLKTFYVDKWLVDVQNSRKCWLYKHIKFELKLEHGVFYALYFGYSATQRRFPCVQRQCYMIIDVHAIR